MGGGVNVSAVFLRRSGGEVVLASKQMAARSRIDPVDAGGIAPLLHNYHGHFSVDRLVRRIIWEKRGAMLFSLGRHFSEARIAIIFSA